MTLALICFLDGLVMHGDTLYILTPADPSIPYDIERVQVVALDREMLTGTVVRVITDPDMDGVASGAMFGGALYVNDARYSTFAGPDTESWITRLNVGSAHAAAPSAPHTAPARLRRAARTRRHAASP